MGQEKLEAAHQAGTLPELSVEALRLIAGKRISSLLEQMTDHLYGQVFEAAKFNGDALRNTVATFRRLYPKAGHPGFEDLPERSENNETPRRS